MKRSELRKLILEIVDEAPLDDVNLQPLVEKLSEGKDIEEVSKIRTSLVSVLTELKQDGDIWFTDQGLNLTSRQGNVWFNSSIWVRSTAKYVKEKLKNTNIVANSSSVNEIDVLSELLKSAEKISYSNREEFDLIKKRAELLIRKFFGESSHYIEDFKAISYSPLFITSGGFNDFATPFEEGLKQFRTLLKIMIEDKKLSTNYNSSKPIDFIENVNIPKPNEKPINEIRVLIASPGDVTRERELLIDKLESKFRREHFEQRCNARIIIDGWETVASQSGYAQDVINSDLVTKANIILAVFRHKLGSPTIDIQTGKDRSASGTAEELLYAIRNKMIKNPHIGMAYFYANAPVLSLDSVDFDRIKTDWDRLKAFKNEIKNEILYKSYNDEESILDIVAKDICDNIIKYFTGVEG